MSEAPTISTHVLDTQLGQPAVGVNVSLYRVEGEAAQQVGTGMTDEDGRIRRLIEGPLTAGDFRLDFEIGGPFFQRLSVGFRVADPGRSYHVPLLLAPYSVSTYRGS
jgi:hydroxyisourate hydrolase